MIIVTILVMTRDAQGMGNILMAGQESTFKRKAFCQHPAHKVLHNICGMGQGLLYIHIIMFQSNWKVWLWNSCWLSLYSFSICVEKIKALLDSCETNLKNLLLRKQNVALSKLAPLSLAPSRNVYVAIRSSVLHSCKNEQTKYWNRNNKSTTRPTTTLHRSPVVHSCKNRPTLK